MDFPSNSKIINTLILRSLYLPQLSENHPIKICHLSSVHFALDTRIFYRMCKTLSEHYAVTLIAIHPKEEIKDGIRIVPFKRYHNLRYRIAFGWLFMLFKAIRQNAKIYHLHDPELIPCGLFLRLLGKKVILDIHENIAEDIFDKPWIKHQKMAYLTFNFFEKLACRFFTILLAEKSYEKRYRDLKANFSTVQNFADTDFFKLFEKKSYSHMLNLYYIGIVLENRGILQIAEAVHLLEKEGLIADFHCVGEIYTELDTKIKSLPFYENIKKRLHFYGRMPLEQGYAMAADMDIGLCIIKPMNNSIASYPTKLFEYMCIGLPIITSDFKLYKETVEDNFCGICINPNDPLKLKNAIQEMHRDVKKTEQMAENGKKTVKNKYNWKSQTSILTGVYERLCGQKQ